MNAPKPHHAQVICALLGIAIRPARGILDRHSAHAQSLLPLSEADAVALNWRPIHLRLRLQALVLQQDLDAGFALNHPGVAVGPVFARDRPQTFR